MKTLATYIALIIFGFLAVQVYQWRQMAQPFVAQFNATAPVVRDVGNKAEEWVDSGYKKADAITSALDKFRFFRGEAGAFSSSEDLTFDPDEEWRPLTEEEFAKLQIDLIKERLRHEPDYREQVRKTVSGTQ